MKAILIVDIPDFVNTVTKGVLKPIGTVGKLEIGYGSDDGEMTRFQFINTDGALLKPMPQEKEDLYFPCNEYEQAFNEGYNRCIDDILGEKDE